MLHFVCGECVLPRCHSLVNNCFYFFLVGMMRSTSWSNLNFIEICSWRSLSFSLSVPSFLMWSLDWTWHCFTDVSSWFFIVLTFSFNALICEDIKLANVLPSVKDVERKIFGSDELSVHNVILICCRWASSYSNWHAGNIFLKYWTQHGRLWLVPSARNLTVVL